jgi:hypothetical protein
MARQTANGRVISAREVTGARPFNLDDAGAEIGKLPSGEWNCDRLLDGHHNDAAEGLR